MRFVYKVGIVSLLASIFLMSHNSFAAQTVFDITNYNVVRSAGFPKISCTFSESSFNVTNVATCQATSTTNTVSLYRLYTQDSYSFKYGDIVEYDLLVYSPTKLSVLDGVINALGAAPEYPFRSLSFEQTAGDVFTSISSGSGSTLLNGNVYYSVFHYSLMYVGPDDGVYPLGRNTGYSVMFNWFEGILEFRMVNFIQYRAKNKSQVNQEQEDATQDAAQQSENTANNNSSSSQTTNLIGAFQSFVTALTSLNATNCNVTLAWPSSLGGNMQVNICQNKDYAGNIISVFGSLTLIVFYIPFSLKILSMIYNEIRSFTNG